MNRPILLVMFVAIVIAGCQKKPDGTKQEQEAADTARSVDTAAQAPSAQPEKILSYEQTQGAFLYGKYCAVCHGEEGKGDGFNAFNLDPRPRDLSDSSYMKALSNDQILQTISGGGRSVNKSPLMPAYGWTLGKDQIRHVALYIRSFAE